VHSKQQSDNETRYRELQLFCKIYKLKDVLLLTHVRNIINDLYTGTAQPVNKVLID